jgi:AcrR family transcriptional regulator
MTARRVDARRNEQPCSTRPPPPSSRRASKLRCATSRRGPGSGSATVYRHFPTRADLVVAVYRHQVEACAEADLNGLERLRGAGPLDRPVRRLPRDQARSGGRDAPDSADFAALHTYFLDRLLPVCTRLLDAAAAAGAIRADVQAYELMRGVGNLCIGRGARPRLRRAAAGRAPRGGAAP